MWVFFWWMAAYQMVMQHRHPASCFLVATSCPFWLRFCPSQFLLLQHVHSHNGIHLPSRAMFVQNVEKDQRLSGSINLRQTRAHLDQCLQEAKTAPSWLEAESLPNLYASMNGLAAMSTATATGQAGAQISAASNTPAVSKLLHIALPYSCIGRERLGASLVHLCSVARRSLHMCAAEDAKHSLLSP